MPCFSHDAFNYNTEVDAETVSCERTGILKGTEVCACPLKPINTSVLCTKKPWKTWYLLWVLCFAGKYILWIFALLVNCIVCHTSWSPSSSAAFWHWRKNQQNSSLQTPPSSVVLLIFSDANLHWKRVHWLCDDAQPARPQTRWGQKQRRASSSGHWLHWPVLHLHQKVSTAWSTCKSYKLDLSGQSQRTAYYGLSNIGLPCEIKM